MLDIPAGRIGVIGLAFKENTDDLRESPVVAMLEQLIGKGRNVRVFDPHIQLEAIYGGNRQFILKVIPHIGRLLDSSLDQTLAWAAAPGDRAEAERGGSRPHRRKRSSGDRPGKRTRVAHASACCCGLQPTVGEREPEAGAPAR